MNPFLLTEITQAYSSRVINTVNNAKTKLSVWQTTFSVKVKRQFSAFCFPR